MPLQYFFKEARPNGQHGSTRKRPDGKIEVVVGGYGIPVDDFLIFAEMVKAENEVPVKKAKKAKDDGSISNFGEEVIAAQ